VKPHKEGSSLGIHVITEYDQLYNAIQHASWIEPKQQQAILIEEKIEGMEFSCITIRDYHRQTWIAFTPTEIVPENGSLFFDYTQKYMPGRAHKFTPPRCSATVIQAIQETCVRICDLLGITTISRIDGFVQADGTVVIVDPNTLSGMGATSFLFREAAEHNMSHTQLINHLIDTELYQYNKINSNTFEMCDDKTAHNTENKKPKIRVAVIFGGDSNEKEISLESGRNVVYKLSPSRYEVLPLFVTTDMKLYHIDQSLLVRSSTTEIASLLDRAIPHKWHDLPHIADFVFIALHGGKGENGSVQGTLEMLKMPYNGSSVLASALCMDKHRTAELLRAHGIATPRQLLIAHERWRQEQENCITMIEQQIGFPAIIKPHDDGCSMLVQKANNDEELIDAMNTLFISAKQYALIEECVVGMELTVGVVGNHNPRALPPSQAVACAGILSKHNPRSAAGRCACACAIHRRTDVQSSWMFWLCTY
jgi:D-alanine-D-alanine ligase